MDDFYIGFIYESEWILELRMGECVKVCVIVVKLDGFFNLLFCGRVYEVLNDDVEMILIYLWSVGGEMLFGDKLDLDVICVKFGISKV